MLLENLSNITMDREDDNLDLEDDRHMKIFRKSSFRDKQRDIQDIPSDDANMKIYFKSNWN